MESVTSDDGFKVTSSDESADDMRVALEMPEPEPEPEPAPEPEPPPESEPKAAASAAPPKIDKRTREGKKASIQAEIDELVGTKHHTEREVTAARAELDRLRAELATVTPKPAPPAAKPTPDKFPSYQEMLATKPDMTPEDWLDQRDEWRDTRKAQQAQQAETARVINQRVGTFQKKYQEAAAKSPDFSQKTGPLLLVLRPAASLQPGEQVTGATAIADTVLDSDSPDRLLTHFVEHPDDFQRISTLHPVQAFREMGKLEARLDAASSTGPARAPIISQAKPPLKPVSGSPTISDDGADEENLPLHEFVRRGNAKSPRR